MVAKIEIQTSAMQCDSNTKQPEKVCKSVMNFSFLKKIYRICEVSCVSAISAACLLWTTVSLPSCGRPEKNDAPNLVQKDDPKQQPIENSSGNKDRSVTIKETVSKKTMQEHISVESETDIKSFKDEWKVLLGEVSITGDTKKKDVKRAISSHLREFRSCFGHDLLKKAGQVIIEYRISSNGTVIEGGIIGTNIKSIEVVNCMNQKVPRWRFPPSNNDDVYLVTVTFHLERSTTTRNDRSNS